MTAGDVPEQVLSPRRYQPTAMTARETPLEMARRHVRMMQDRIVRQEAAVARLKAQRHDQAAALGEALLADLRAYLSLCEGHVVLFTKMGEAGTPS